MSENTPSDEAKISADEAETARDVNSALSQLPEKEAKILKPIVERLPEEQRVELLEVIESHRGWLPPPGMLAEYERVLPGLAERIVAMPEREQAHRHDYVATESDRQFKIRRRGQDYALVGMVLILSFALILALSGETEWAVKLVIGTLVGIVGIFVTGKWFDAKAASEDEESGG